MSYHVFFSDHLVVYPTHGPMMSPTIPQVSSLLVLAALGLAFIVSGPWTPWVPLGVPLGLSTAPGRPGSCGSWRCKDFRSEHYRNTNITNVRMNIYIYNMCINLSVCLTYQDPNQQRSWYVRLLGEGGSVGDLIAKLSGAEFLAGKA